jgi:hypothetical protein
VKNISSDENLSYDCNCFTAFAESNCGPSTVEGGRRTLFTPDRLVAMGRRARIAMAVLAWSLAMTLAPIAEAEDRSEPIRLEYRADAGCPTEAEFVARVRARTASARFVGPGEAARTFVVDVRVGPQASGRVTVTDGAQTELTRRLNANTCREVADGLGLMVALAIDPLAQPALALSSPLDSAPVQSAPPSSTETINAPDTGGSPVIETSAAPSSASANAESTPAPRPGSTLSSITSSTPRNPHFATRVPGTVFLGADLGVTTGVTPRDLVAGSAIVGWRPPSGSAMHPILRAAFLRTETGALRVPWGAAAFTWTVGRVDACALLSPGSRVQGGACARIEAGILDATGSGVTIGQTAHSPWIAAGPVGHIEWVFLGSLFLELAGGPTVRAFPTQFVFRQGPTSLTAFTVPMVGLDAEIGLAVHFL